MADHKSDKLIVSAQAVLHGLTLHGTWINAPHDATAILESKIHRLHEAIGSLESAQSNRKTANDRVTIADRSLKSWLSKARLVVMLARGARWSESWTHTGFTDSRTKIPKRIEERILLGRALVTFFARHPELGVPFAEVTAARGRTICERAAQSNEILELAKKDYAVMKQQFQLAESDLLNANRKMIRWLKAHLEGSDNRWVDFGMVISQRARRSSSSGSRQRRIPSIEIPTPSSGHHQVAAA